MSAEKVRAMMAASEKANNYQFLADVENVAARSLGGSSKMEDEAIFSLMIAMVEELRLHSLFAVGEEAVHAVISGVRKRGLLPTR